MMMILALNGERPKVVQRKRKSLIFVLEVVLRSANAMLNLALTVVGHADF